MAKYEKYLYLFLDLIALNGSFAVGFMVKYGHLNKFRFDEYQLLLLGVNFIWAFVFLLSRYDFNNRRINTTRLIADYIKFGFLNIIIILALLTLFKSHNFSRVLLLSNYLLFISTGSVLRIAFNRFLRSYREKGFNYKRVAIVGNDEYAKTFINEMNGHPEYGYRFCLFISDQKHLTLSDEIQSCDLDQAQDALIDQRINEVFISNMNYSKELNSLVTFCYLNNVRVNIINRLINGINKGGIKTYIDDGGHIPVITIKDAFSHFATRILAKRALDLLFSTLVIVFVLSWLYPLMAILIKMESKGPVLFKQARTGLNNKSFNCLKFRSMRVNAESNTKQASRNDSRITKVGAFIRKTNLDEFPQFINVFLGHMSVVGPRPHMLEHTKKYSSCIQEYHERLWLKPGITGLSQATGLRGETQQVKHMKRRVERDRNYIYHWSFQLDLKIIMFTVWNMLTFRKSGA